MNISDLQNEIREFSVDRDWEQFHTVRNLILALVGEVGELAEVVQWAGDICPEDIASNPALERQLSDEIADVLIYLLRLADVAGFDLPATVVRKMRENAARYPAAEVRGRADKR